MFLWYSRNVRQTRKKKGRSEKGLGTLQQRGRLWYFRITIDGKEYTHATKTADLEQARLERDRFLRTLRPVSSLTPPMRTRRVLSSMKKSTCSVFSLIVSTVNRSQAMIEEAWVR